MNTYVHTYVRYWSLQSFSQDYDLVFHSTYVLCVNVACEWWNLQFKVNSDQEIFGNFLFLFAFSFCQKFLESK